MRRRCWEILSFILAGCMLMGCGGASKDNESVQSDIPEQWTNICMSADKKRRASTAIGVRYQDSDYADYYALLSSGDVSHFFPEDFSNITTVPAVSAAEPDKVKKEVMELAEKLEIKLQKEPYVFVGLEAV